MAVLNQTSNLRPTVATGVLQVPQQHTTLALLATAVVKAGEHATDVHIPLAIVACRRKLNRGAGAEKLLELLDRGQPYFVHVDHHPCDDQPTPHFPPISFLQAHPWLQRRSSFRFSRNRA